MPLKEGAFLWNVNSGFKLSDSHCKSPDWVFHFLTGEKG